MADHAVDQIADRFEELLCDETAAEDRVYRDRSPLRPFQGIADLPSIDIQIGPDNPVDDQISGKWRSEVQIFVDLYVHAPEDSKVSHELLELRKETYIALMGNMPGLPGTSIGVIMVLPGGAEPVVRGESGSTHMAYMRTVFYVTYQHSLTRPDQ